MKYVVIVEDIFSKIQQDVYKEGTKIPTEEELSKIYGCSKITVKKALDVLSDKGIVFRLRGSGTFVRKNIKSFNDYQTSQTQGFTRTNMKRYKIKTIVNEFETVYPTNAVSLLMDIEPFEYVYYFERLRSKDDSASSVERSYVPIKFVSGLTSNILQGSLFEFVEKTTKCKIKSIHKNISIINADRVISEFLKIKVGEKIVLSEELHYLSNGEIFEYSLVYMRTEDYNAYEIYNS